MIPHPGILFLLLSGAAAFANPDCRPSGRTSTVLLADGSFHGSSMQPCPSGSACLDDGRCISVDSILSTQGAGEDSSRFLRRSAQVLMSKGAPKTAVTLLIRSLDGSPAKDSVRLELAEALLRSGRVEEALEVNYGLDTVKGEFLDAVLRQRRDFFLLIGMPEEAAKVDVQLLERPVAKDARAPFRPRVVAGWTFSHSKMIQDGADTSVLKDIMARYQSDAVQASENRIESMLSQGYSQTANAGLTWTWLAGNWSASLAPAGSATFTSDLSGLRSWNGSVSADVSRHFGEVLANVGIDLGTTRYVGSSDWWNRTRSIGIGLFRPIESGSASLSLRAIDQFTPLQPSGLWNWQATLAASRNVPRLPWLEARFQGSVQASRQPAVQTQAARVAWCSGLDAGKSTFATSPSIVHYADSAGNVTESVNPYTTGISDLTYHSASILQTRDALSQVAPSLNLDLTARLPADFALTASGSLGWIRHLGTSAWCNSKGAATENGDLLVWKDRVTGKEYIFASSTSRSTLQELQVQTATRTDATRSLALGGSWSSALLGTFAIGTGWTWADIDPYSLDPTSRYRTWDWSTSWSRTW